MKIIETDNLTKHFNIQHEAGGTFLKSLWSYIFPKKDIHISINSLSISVNKGEVLGLIGNNGAGKSTLLKLIAHIYKASKGSITTKGSVLFLGGLNKGLKQRLSVEDNIYLISSLLGLSPKETSKQLPIILSYANLEEYRNAKIYQLSRGMQQRLSFSLVLNCALHNSPDIILLDEIFSKGGDVRFKKKAKRKIAEFIEESKTVVLVSHNTNVVKKFATRVIWLDKGSIVLDGEPEVVIEKYLKANEVIS